MNVDARCGKVIKFPTSRRRKPGSGDFAEKITTGEAEFLGTLEKNGFVYDYYRITEGGEVTFIFNVMT